METSEMTREKRLRRAAARQGLRLSKSPRRDRYANDYGKYRVERADSNGRVGSVVAGGAPFDYSLNLDQVELVLFPHRHGHPLNRDEDFENAITPHAPHNGNWAGRPDDA